jgi:hypothetical protein
LLHSAKQLVAYTESYFKFVVGDFAPLGLYPAFELLPVAFNAIPIHRRSFQVTNYIFCFASLAEFCSFSPPRSMSLPAPSKVLQPANMPEADNTAAYAIMVSAAINFFMGVSWLMGPQLREMPPF